MLEVVRFSGLLAVYQICFGLAACLGVRADPLANWKASSEPCKQRFELLKRGPMTVGARMGTANPILAEQFRYALDFWATVVALDWHEDNTEACAIQVMDGGRELFERLPDNMAARSQFPDRLDFQGWIAFNPSVSLTKNALYRISVHEIGHLLGLRHSSNARSLMYSLDLDDSNVLDSADLAALAAHHQLRVASLNEPVLLTRPSTSRRPPQPGITTK